MDKTKFTLGKCSLPVFFATNCTNVTNFNKSFHSSLSLTNNVPIKGVCFKFGIEVGFGESIENAPLV
jgi:hypothetical protein